MSKKSVSRRDFMKGAISTGIAVGITTSNRNVQARILGANDRIQIGVIGVGGRGRYLLREVLSIQESTSTVKVLAVSDVYEKRKKIAQDLCKGEAYADYRELLARDDLDAVIVATPDHWHARMAIEAMNKGKDVYLEKPMTHTVEEARQVVEAAERNQRVLQVGSQTTSSDQWWKARKVIEEGGIGQLIMSQGSYHRNSTEGEWNWPIDAEAGPNGQGENFIDWKMWLGPAPERPYDADRFFRFRKYWDYSGGIATDLFYHVMAPLNICWGQAQFPYRVSGNGGIYVFKDEREVPDTFTLTADYGAGHTVCLSSSMANDTHIPGLIRGHEGTIIMVPDGQFEGRVDYITVVPQKIAKDKFRAKYGNGIEVKLECEKRESHMMNFLNCVRNRQKPVLDALTGYKAQVTISLSVQSYREGRVLYFDEAIQKIVDKPPKQTRAISKA
ncbi:MAG: gfo/Idh/MocA family oxidoreductase [Acidobacteria bacterium]|nr:MAG: gfo/Idh/MocA family oxidoreductase [Acidobacteriota bacterium]